MAERSERSASNRVVIGTTVLQIFEGLVQYRLWVPWRVHHGQSVNFHRFFPYGHLAEVALLCLAGTCFSPQVEVKLLPEQSGVQLWLGHCFSCNVVCVCVC